MKTPVKEPLSGKSFKKLDIEIEDKVDIDGLMDFNRNLSAF